MWLSGTVTFLQMAKIGVEASKDFLQEKGGQSVSEAASLAVIKSYYNSRDSLMA